MKIFVLRALVLAVLVLAGALVFAGCRPGPVADPRTLLHYHEGFTCAAELTDIPCISCLKEHCCEEARACTNKGPEMCPCSAKCIGQGNAQACMDRCAAAEDRALGTCSVKHCTLICPGTGATI